MSFLNWVMGCVLVYAFLFGIGEIIFGQWAKGIVFIAVGLSAGLVILRTLNRAGWETQV